MPKNLIRYQQMGHLHFVTFSCYRRQPLLADPSRRELFEQSPGKVRLRYDLFVTVEVVMHSSTLRSIPNRLPRKLVNMLATAGFRIELN